MYCKRLNQSDHKNQAETSIMEDKHVGALDTERNAMLWLHDSGHTVGVTHCSVCAFKGALCMARIYHSLCTHMQSSVTHGNFTETK